MAAERLGDGPAPAASARRTPSLATATAEPARAAIGPDQLLAWYRTMLVCRAADELMWIVGRQGRAHFILTSRGHEAAQVASAAALRAGHDYVFTYYRSIAAALQLGVTPRELFLSMLGKAGDPFAGGRQLPNHFSMPRLRIPTVSSSVGTQIPHATGAGYAARVLGADWISVAYFGDGATAKGEFHEGLNFAAIWRLPVVFFCENNGWAISVPTRLESPVPIYQRAAAYGIPGVRVDGCDPAATYLAMRQAVARARRGEGPTLIEAEVVRLVPHSNADDDSYRGAEELAAARARDPLPRLRRELEEIGALDAAGAEALEATARREVEAALDWAETQPDPDPSEAKTHLYQTLH